MDINTLYGTNSQKCTALLSSLNLKTKNKFNILVQNNQAIHSFINTTQDNANQVHHQLHTLQAFFKSTHSANTHQLTKQIARSQKENLQVIQIMNTKANTKVNSIAARLEMREQKRNELVQNTTNQYRQLKRKLEDRLKNYKKKYSECCEQFYCQMNEEMKEIEDAVQMETKNLQENSSKIANAIGLLSMQLQQILNEQKKQGQVTHDCLLALLDQSITHLQKKNILTC